MSLKSFYFMEYEVFLLYGVFQNSLPIVKLGVQELLSLGSLSSSTKDKLSRSPLDPGA